MRIIAGEFKGRRLKRPSDGRVRVTPDRVREAWFSILAPSLHGAYVLDLFAGSGALGLEALSRNARHVDFVDVSTKSVDDIKTNVRALGVADRALVLRRDALRFAMGLAEGTYDVALADPPYSTDQAKQLSDIFRERSFARVLSIEHQPDLELNGDETRRYGNVAVSFFYQS